MNLKKIKRPKWIPAWLSIPFLLFIAFIVFMLFFGEYNFREISKQQQEIDHYKAMIKEQEDSAKYYERKTQELNTDKETLEKIAREEYKMKRTNEDVYITDIP